jgi:hypothetical protein
LVVVTLVSTLPIGQSKLAAGNAAAALISAAAALHSSTVLIGYNPFELHEPLVIMK